MKTTHLGRWIALRLGAILFGSAIVGLAATLLTIRDRFDDLETWLVERQLERSARVLEQETREVERTTADYAHWDDALAFVEGRNPGFIVDNFTRESAQNLNMDALVVWDTAGRALAALDFAADADFHPLPEPVERALAASWEPWPDDGVLRRDSQLVFLDGLPAVVARVSVSDGDRAVPSRGSVAFVRRIDAEEYARLVGLAGVQFALEPHAGAAIDGAVARAANGWEGRDTLAPGVLLAVTVPALLSGELRATGWTLALVAALNLLVCVVWIRGVLRSKVTGRLERFAALSERMDGGARWPVEGRDEIDTLASALNHLVDDLGRQQAALDRLANSDLVTGLPNRRRLLEVLDERLGAGGAASSVLVYIDLVGFKSINDVHGHAAGDAVLAVFGERLRQLPAPLFCAARVGGDEFGLVLDGVGLHDGAAWFGTVIDGLVKPVDWAGHRVRFNLIAGVAARPDQGDVTTWMSMADLAMYAARRERQGRVGLFTEALRASSATRRVIGERLYGAIESGEIQAWFQPVVRASDGEVVGFEALARWRLDDTWISPDQFVPAAEDAGLIGRLTERILEQTCDFLTALAATGRADVRCSVNVSPGQVADPQLAEQLLAVLDARGVDPRRLAVEITEEAVQSRHERVAETLSVLRARGVQVWLDDFGIGHASFARLRDFSFDVLKIDRSFTRVRGDGMLEGIVQFGQRMGLSVTAEGVETAEDLEALRAMGCDRVQGYHIGRPMPAEQAVAWRSPAKCA